MHPRTPVRGDRGIPERPGSLPLAELVAEQRARLSLSLAAVAKRMGTAADEAGSYSGASRQTIHQIEQDRIPHPDRLHRASSKPSPADGRWQLGRLHITQRARQLLQDEPLMVGPVLRDELHFARTVVRAAALVTADQEGDSARIRGCEQVLSRGCYRPQGRAPRAPPVGLCRLAR